MFWFVMKDRKSRTAHLWRWKRQSKNMIWYERFYESFLIKAVQWVRRRAALWTFCFECWCLSESFIHFQFKLVLSSLRQNHWYSNNLSGMEVLLYFGCVEGCGLVRLSVCDWFYICACVCLGASVISIQGRERKILVPKLIPSFICLVPCCSYYRDLYSSE